MVLRVRACGLRSRMDGGGFEHGLAVWGHTHMDLLRTYEAIVAIIPPPFHDLLGSKVLFTCRSCCKSREQDVATFIVTRPPTGMLLHVAYFEAAFPWSEHRLPAISFATPFHHLIQFETKNHPKIVLPVRPQSL